MTTVEEMRPTFTVVACHFGDPFWITEMARRIVAFSTADRVPEILVVDQDRPARHRAALAALPRVRRVVSYPVETGQVERLGHDHPASLNRACREPLDTSHVRVMDSDTLVGDGWLAELDRALARHECVLAGDRRAGISHPCFMAMHVEALGAVDFADAVTTLGVDTGRLVGYQLDRAGRSVQVMLPDGVGFSGRRGDLYLGSTVLHVKSASFSSSSDERVRRQANERLDRIVRDRVAEGRLTLRRRDRAKLFGRALVRRVL